MSLASFFGRKKLKPVAPPQEESDISRITELMFRYRTGASEVRYELEAKDDGYTAMIRLEGESADDAVTVAVADDVADEIADLLSTYDVMRWDGFHESERGVLDGDRFSLSVYFSDGNGVSADGYMSFPDSFDEVCEGLGEIFRRVRETAVQP